MGQSPVLTPSLIIFLAAACPSKAFTANVSPSTLFFIDVACGKDEQDRLQSLSICEVFCE